LNVESWFGKASVPICSIVTFGFVIVNFITYSSLSSFNNSLAASKSKLIPSTSG